MVKKIKNNKIIKRTLIFISVFVVLCSACILPVFAQAPIIDINGSSNDFSTGMYYFSEPSSNSNNSIVLMSFTFMGSSGVNEYYVFFEPFFDNYGFSIADNPSDIYDILEEDYYHNDYDTSNYLVYDGYGSTYMLYGCFYGRSAFVNSWNSQLSWAITKNNEVNTLTQQNNVLNNSITAKNEQIASLQLSVDNINRQYQTLSGQYDYLNTAYNDLQSNYNTLQTSNNALQSNYNTLQYDYTNLNNSYNTLQEEYNYLLEDVTNAFDNGYTQALNDYNAFEEGIFSIFNAPFVFVSNIVSFEIFGVSMIDLLALILVLCLGYVLIKFIGGALPL